MRQKNATPNKAQQAILKQHGLSVFGWVVVKELPYSLIVKNRLSGEFRVLEKT